jgi:hypothetical protein
MTSLQCQCSKLPPPTLSEGCVLKQKRNFAPGCGKSAAFIGQMALPWHQRAPETLSKRPAFSNHQ